MVKNFFNFCNFIRNRVVVPVSLLLLLWLLFKMVGWVLLLDRCGLPIFIVLFMLDCDGIVAGAKWEFKYGIFESIDELVASSFPVRFRSDDTGRFAEFIDKSRCCWCISSLAQTSDWLLFDVVLSVLTLLAWL